MSKELEKAQHAIRELTVEMSGTEYEEFMRQLAEWVACILTMEILRVAAIYS